MATSSTDAENFGDMLSAEPDQSDLAEFAIGIDQSDEEDDDDSDDSMSDISDSEIAPGPPPTLQQQQQQQQHSIHMNHHMNPLP